MGEFEHHINAPYHTLLKWDDRRIVFKDVKSSRDLNIRHTWGRDVTQFCFLVFNLNVVFYIFGNCYYLNNYF